MTDRKVPKAEIERSYGLYDLQALLVGRPLAMAIEGWCFACGVRLEQIATTGPKDDPTAITECPCCRFEFQIVNRANRLYPGRSVPWVASSRRRVDVPECEHRVGAE